jgi:hypothetical protein
MAPKSLEILKKGLARFKEKIKTRKKDLETKLAKAETISSLDEHWLDHEANTVDEEHIINTLESASNYEQGLEHLDEAGKAIVKKLREWAGDLAKVAGKKRKRTNFPMSETKTSLTYLVKVPNMRKNLGNLRTNLISQLLLPFSRKKRMQLWLNG